MELRKISKIAITFNQDDTDVEAIIHVLLLHELIPMLKSAKIMMAENYDFTLYYSDCVLQETIKIDKFYNNQIDLKINDIHIRNIKLPEVSSYIKRLKEFLNADQ